MRVLVCGGRDFSDQCLVNSVLDDLHKQYDFTALIEGGARGADNLAKQWALENYVPVKEYNADWKTHGKSAGYKRNTQMLEDGQPELVVAFPGGKGTAMMVKIAKNAHVNTIVYT
jgi:hypothetical protein